MDPVPWRQAWQSALYAAGLGFYVARGGPSAHFTTATHGVTGAVLAQALLDLWHRERGVTPPALVVDVGAGRGELATHLADVVDPVTAVLAVDVVARPDGLDPRVDWLESPGGAGLPSGLVGLSHALVIGHEWLDVVPCVVAEVDESGRLREVLVDPASGGEQLGDGLPAADLAWVGEHWPAAAPGDRVEVGRARDGAWADLVARVESGLLVAVDYGHVREARPPRGTLTAYRSGTQTEPVPDGSCDITAHVAMDSLDADLVTTQRELLRSLGVRGATPDHALAIRDPMAYLRALERSAAEAELIRPGGFGDFWWALKRVGAPDIP
ncbi:SAM-dependent methyltransferase [Intrasporangium calvum]|uniref:SAM-dependent methyltransferase n=1 Tax=Intrasporangium calvum TaxID=53358 RepID=A0ABT5GEX5_9MICO|nr:SAM-dependent methyltransferase [Intrasporangium calvum]MDC5696241.1 SAM-dependent methyltransferase [Intrasporangium calvum]